MESTTSSTDLASKKASNLYGDAQPSPADNVHPPQATLLFKDNGIIIKKHFSTATELSSHLLNEEKNSEGARHRLYTLQGLPLSYVQVFGAHFDIDPSLFDSHAYRESDHLIGRIRHNAVRGVRLFALDYVEMWLQPGPFEEYVRTVQQGDVMKEPRAFLFDHNDWPGLLLRVLLCHVTLINMRNADGTETSLLLFDTPVRFRRQQIFLRLSRLSKLMSPKERSWPPEIKTEVFEDSLEDQLFEIFAATRKDLDFTYDKICEAITDIALRNWAELSDKVSYKFLDNASNHIELLQRSLIILRRGPRMLRKHKRELNDVRDQARVEGQIAEWEALFNFGDLLTIAAVSARRDSTEPESTIESIFERRASNKISSQQVYADTSSSSDDKHRIAAEESIERITYLGGILLPFSISAGIFSMSGDYTPGEDKFYLFWVVSVPLVLLTIVLIYADYIRRKTFGEYADEEGIITPATTRPTSAGSDEPPQSGSNQPAQRPPLVEHRRPDSAGSARHSDHAARTEGHERIVLDRRSRVMVQQPTIRRRPEDEQIGWLRAFGTLVGYNPAKALRKKTEEARSD